MCAADDGTPNSVKSDTNVHCVGNLFLKYWVTAIATVISHGKCDSEKYLACEACCKNPQGGYIPDCDDDDCQTQCKKDEYASLHAIASAAITFEEESSATCTDTKTVNYEKYWLSYAPKTHVRACVPCAALLCIVCVTTCDTLR